MTDSSQTPNDPLAGYSVVLVGCGQMGSAIIRRVVSSGAVPGSRVFLVDAVDARAQALAEELDAKTGWPVSDSPPRLVILATKPKHAKKAIEWLPHTERDVLVSVCAGIPIALLRQWAPEPEFIVRTMPNTPSLIGAGVTGIMGEPGADLEPVRVLFESVGKVVRLHDESDFDGLTAISGSGPAYIFTLIEALADGGVLMGLRREVARELAMATIEGAARLAAHDEAHTAELKDRVASPAGTTIAALRELERGAFRHTVISAVEAAATRSKQLGEDLQKTHEDG